jgi:hypothetical protein
MEGAGCIIVAIAAVIVVAVVNRFRGDQSKRSGNSSYGGDWG